MLKLTNAERQCTKLTYRNKWMLYNNNEPSTKEIKKKES